MHLTAPATNPAQAGALETAEVNSHPYRGRPGRCTSNCSFLQLFVTF